MADETQEIRPVMPIIMDGCGWREEENGNALKPIDISPTILARMGLSKPGEMTGKMLFSR